ncbi:MAG: putative heme-binding protein [Verrucomicrobiales bacterium]|nr:putative heme-binding protein [Verrucomicrobiales bacterium]
MRMRMFWVFLIAGCFIACEAADVSEKFQPWRSNHLVGSPEPPSPFRTVRIYPNVKSHEGKSANHDPFGPVAAQREPGANRIIFMENYGYGELRTVLRRFEAKPNAAEAESILELKEHGYCITFHPQFATNGYVFLGLNGPNPSGKVCTRIVRYTFNNQSPRHVLPESRKLIIEWPSNGHNGGDCAFGKDGMLYVTSGDGTSGLDVDNMGQNLSAMLSKVLRIDADGAAADQGYIVPKDNPFVGTEGIRPETWAYGLRNPWRITSDVTSGQIWVGENGQDLREYAHLLGRGENYGWSAYEGSRPFLLARLRGPSPFTPPTIEHDHGMFRSLTGGLVYRGKAFPELDGAYLYGDFTTGRIWAMKHDGSKVFWHRELVDTALNVVGFGKDVDGEPLIVDYNGGFNRLERRPPSTDLPAFPKLLSATGLFEDLKTLRPAPGVVPYQINAHGWHDEAYGDHWMGLPANVKIHPEADSPWNADDGIVLAQTLSLSGTGGPRRIETRVLLKQENDWTAYTYIWNEEQSEAALAPANGERLKLNLSDSTKRTWAVPSRTECLMCHSRAANFALTLNTRQLNRGYGDANSESQLKWLEQNGITTTLPQGIEKVPAFTPMTNTSLSVESRARTYLAVNCAHCHTQDGGGNAAMNLLPQLKLSDMHLLNEPAQHGLGGKDAKIVTPGAPARSVLMTRVALRIPGQMPPVGTIRPDFEGVKMLTSWISSLPAQDASGR